MMEFMGREEANPLRLRVLDIGETPSIASREWETYLSFLSEEEKCNVLKYRMDDDRRRALVSVFLQKSTVRRFLGAERDSDFRIERTPEVSVPASFIDS